MSVVAWVIAFLHHLLIFVMFPFAVLVCLRNILCILTPLHLLWLEISFKFVIIRSLILIHYKPLICIFVVIVVSLVTFEVVICSKISTAFFIVSIFLESATAVAVVVFVETSLCRIPLIRLRVHFFISIILLSSAHLTSSCILLLHACLPISTRIPIIIINIWLCWWFTNSAIFLCALTFVVFELLMVRLVSLVVAMGFASLILVSATLHLIL